MQELISQRLHLSMPLPCCQGGKKFLGGQDLRVDAAPVQPFEIARVSTHRIVLQRRARPHSHAAGPSVCAGELCIKHEGSQRIIKVQRFP